MKKLVTLSLFLLGACANVPVSGPAAETLNVNRADPQLYAFQFTPDKADGRASQALNTQLAFLDTRVAPLGKLVVYLHGAGTFETCGSRQHGAMLAGLGFHVFSPCYRSDYGVQNCGDDIAGCRLEAFEGKDHHPFINISRANSIEGRVIAGLALMQQLNPAGDWQYFLDGEDLRWEKIIISGISHGASSAGVIGKNRRVDRVVMLSGPLDTGQAWLTAPSLTPIDRFYGFTHADDRQHEGHLEAFEQLGMTGEPVLVDGAAPPFGGSHRLFSQAPTENGHRAMEASGPSPRVGDSYVYEAVWQYLYGAAPGD